MGIETHVLTLETLDGVRLEAENPAYEPIRTKDARVMGKVVGVFRTV